MKKLQNRKINYIPPQKKRNYIFEKKNLDIETRQKLHLQRKNIHAKYTIGKKGGKG